MVARDEDGLDNQVSYSIYNYSDFDFTIDEDGTIRNQELFPTVTAAEVRK